MTTDVVIGDVQDGVAWLRLDRPRAKNALTLEMLDCIDAAFAALAEDDAVRVIVIGSGNDSFCAGADLKSLGTLDLAADPAAVPRRVQQTLAVIRHCAKPVIAAIGGVTAAGGLELAMACDIRIASTSARIGDAHLKAGVIPGAGSAAVLPRLIGSGAAKLLLYTGELWDAARCHSAGLVDLVVDDAALENEVSALAGRIARASPLGLAITKRLVDRCDTQGIDAVLVEELRENETYALSADFREGMNAFAEKRQPRFTGR